MQREGRTKGLRSWITRNFAANVRCRDFFRGAIIPRSACTGRVGRSDYSVQHSKYVHSSPSAFKGIPDEALVFYSGIRSTLAFGFGV